MSTAVEPRIESVDGCRHCGLPVPPARREREDSFCCEGCARVFSLLHAEGLERYYELRGVDGTPAPELRPGGKAWLDAVLREGAGRPGRPQRLLLDVQGVHCSACVWLLRELFLRRKGAVEIRTNAARGVAELLFVPGEFSVHAYLAEVERFGYRFGPPRLRRPSRSRALLLRLGVCAAATANVMIFSFSLYAGLGPDDGALYPLFGVLSLILTALVVVVGGWVFFRTAVAGLRSGVTHLDLPIALGLALAFAGSAYTHAVRGPEHAYYDTVAVFVTLMLLGRFLQERVLERNRDAVLAADDIDGLVVRRMRGEEIESVPASELAVGDQMLIVAGDLVPVAAIAAGRPGEVALDWISGEPEVQPVAPGDAVPAGAFNAGRTALRLIAGESFATSRLHALLGPATSSEDRPPGPSGVWWTRLGSVYVAAVLLLAAIGFMLWLGRGVEQALRVTVAVLVVTCPCAIGLAVPLAHELTTAGLRRRGIFVRERSFFDRALRVKRVLFDKTGTLTRGGMVLREDARSALDGLAATDRAVLAAMVARSNHPASRSLAAAVGQPGRPLAADFAGMEEVPGQGLAWYDGTSAWRLGRPEFVVPAGAETRRAQGTVWFSREGAVIARFTLGEEARGDVSIETERLEAAGLELGVLSGDDPARVRELARSIGVPVERAEGGLTPEAKAARVRALDRRDTLMVGDGINDAPAFAEAFCTATPAVDRPHLPARADLYYLGDGISAVATSLAAARALRRVVLANLAFAIAYNGVALTLAFAGVVTPLLAAILMPASSLTVVIHTISRLGGRRRRWRS